MEKCTKKISSTSSIVVKVFLQRFPSFYDVNVDCGKIFAFLSLDTHKSNSSKEETKKICFVKHPSREKNVFISTSLLTILRKTTRSCVIKAGAARRPNPAEVKVI